jgi:CBS domain containing-hemolysin-like protein
VTLFLELLGVAALILLNAFFVAGEYGLVTGSSRPEATAAPARC